MLIREHRREPDQAEPDVRAAAQEPGGVTGIEVDEDRAQRDVQRRKEVVGLIERAEGVEDRAEPAGYRRALEGEPQREQKEDAAGRDDRQHDPPSEGAELRAVAAEKRTG